MAAFEWGGLVYRNPSYVTSNARKSWEVAKKMKEYRESYPFCAWCGRTSGLQVHHIEPVSVAPEKAHLLRNMITLCGKRCHITVGHAGNYANSYVPDVLVICDTYSPVKVEDVTNPATKEE